MMYPTHVNIGAHASRRFCRQVSAVLAILVATAMPYAHAQTASSTNASGNIQTARVTGTADAGDHVAHNASMTATAIVAPGFAKTDDKAAGVGQSKSDPSGELTPFHPLTDF